MKTASIYLNLFFALVLISGCASSSDRESHDIHRGHIDTVHFSFTTFDNLELPAQVIKVPDSKRTVIFLNGSTPSDEKGNIGNLLPDGRMIKSWQDFYRRFLEVMSKKGYDVATYAKRSFSYPEIRPSLDELTLDGKYFIEALGRQNLLKDLIIIGYSEGSVVASKLLPNVEAEACIFLGSASQHYDYFKGTWENWPTGMAYQRILGRSDDEIKLEYEQWSEIMRDLTDMDEAYFEETYKASNPHGFGFAPWESYRIDREIQFYNPSDNILNSGTPVLIVIGENDVAMPVEMAKRTYEELVVAGHNAEFYVIPEETHQYLKYDVFAIMHSWLNGKITLEYDDIDQKIVDRYNQITNITATLNALSFEAEYSHLDTLFNVALDANYNIAQQWFKLALILYNNGYLDQALKAFEHASDPDFAVYYAPLVWQGHIHDISGDRERAVQFYLKALDHYPGFPVQHDNLDLVLTEEYIRSRLETPFKSVR
jgi:pimeloyl-ACP methyl ester carboxylesterase